MVHTSTHISTNMSHYVKAELSKEEYLKMFNSTGKQDLEEISKIVSEKLLKIQKEENRNRKLQDSALEFTTHLRSDADVESANEIFIPKGYTLIRLRGQ